MYPLRIAQLVVHPISGAVIAVDDLGQLWTTNTIYPNQSTAYWTRLNSPTP